MFKKLTIQGRLILGFLAVSAITAVIGIYGTIKIKEIDANDELLYHQVAVPLEIIHDINTAFQKTRIIYRDIIEENDPAKIKVLSDSLKQVIQQIDKGNVEYEKSLFNDTGKEGFKKYLSSFNVMKTRLNELITLATQNKDEEAIKFRTTNLRGVTRSTEQEFNNMVHSKINVGKDLSDTNAISANQASTVMISLILIGVILAMGLGLMIAFNIKKINKQLLTETNLLVNAAIEGNLNQRADINKINFEFRDIPLGINKTLDAVTGPLNVAANYIDRISKGDIPSKITDTYNGDFNKIINNLNQCIDAVGLLSNDVNTLSKAAVEGKLSTRVDASIHSGDFKKIIEGVNDTLNTLVGLLDAMPTPAMVIDKEYTILYMNDIGAMVGNKTARQVEGMKCYDHFRTNDCKTANCACTKTMISSRNEKSETTARPGDLTLEIAYSAIPIKNKEGVVTGAFEVVSDQTAIKESMRKSEKIGMYQTKEAIKLTDGLNKLAKGDLNIELVTEVADNDTQEAKKMFEDINSALNMLIKSLNEIITKAKMVAQGDLTVTLTKRSENDGLMEALSEMVLRLSDIVGQVMEAAENVATSSSEMSSSASQISQGANEQSASAEEVSSSIEEMTSTIQQNSDNSVATEKIAEASASGMMDVSSAAQKSIEAMRQISEKIKIINDIAGKTDILAINAAIEAARAGEQGKGFAVVAAEVRKLAEVSQRAAVEINELSASSLRVTEDAGGLMMKIIPEIQKTAQLVKEIAASSQEQRMGSEQITKAVVQFTQVTQQNAAAAEEMSSSSEELASQAELLKETIGYFNTGKQVKATQTVKSSLRAPKVRPAFSKFHPHNLKNGVNIDLDNSDKDDKMYEHF